MSIQNQVKNQVVLGASVSIVIVLFWVSCSIYSTSLLMPGPVADAGPPGDAGVVVDACGRIGVPDPPLHDDPSSTTTVEFTEVFQSVDLGLTQSTSDSGAFTSGYNLDRMCTCPGPESCVVQQAGTKHCDDSQGRDNGAVIILESIANLQQAITRQITAGGFNVIMGLQQYNGTENDVSVSMSMFSSSGTGNFGDAAATPPSFNGTDQFYVDPSSLAVPYGTVYISKYADYNAYVSNGVLVAYFDELIIGFPGSPPDEIPAFNIDLRGAYFSGTIQANDGEGYTIANGNIGGRWSTSSFLSAVGLARSPINSNVPLCNDPVSYPIIKGDVCAAADITSSPDASSLVTCNALSFSLSLQGAPANIAGQAVTMNAPPSGVCFDGGTDDCP
jgi:hypothetical protein